jgi:polygalacturonase
MNRRTFLAASTALLARGADTDPEASVRARIKPPEFPNRDFEVTKYGARGDGSMLCTDAIHKAIAACSEAGVNLRVSEGATLRFSRDPKHYLPAVYSRWEGTECMNYSPFLYAFEQNNIAVTGGGILDG